MYNQNTNVRYFMVTAVKSLLRKIIIENFVGYGLQKSGNVFSINKLYIQNFIPKISEYLNKNLKLNLHSDKIFIKTIVSGIDFLGWVHFSNHRVLRTSTKRRMSRNIQKSPRKETIISYLGMLRWGNGYKLKNLVLNQKL